MLTKYILIKWRTLTEWTQLPSVTGKYFVLFDDLLIHLADFLNIRETLESLQNGKYVIPLNFSPQI